MPDAGGMRLRSKLLACVIAIAVAAGAITLAIPDVPAAAATTGAGYSGITPYGGYLGNYIAPDGTRVYCIDSSREWPSGSTDGGQIVSSIDGLSPVTVRKLNYALLKWGQTADPTNAAAVSAYVYAYTSNYAHSNGAGYYAGLHYINGNAAVQAAYNVVWNESEVHYAGPANAGARVTIDMANAYDGSVTVTTTPSSATGRLTLSGAVVAGSRATTIDVRHGSVVPIRGVPGAGAESYSVTASAAFTIAAGAQQGLVLYSSGSQQRTIRGAFPASLSFGASDATDEIALRFSPVVQTQVAARFIDAGGAFVDGVTATVADGSPAWRTLASGSPAPVVAVGTLYGPFSEQPDVSATPPANAPVVGRERLTLAGPGQYRSAGTLRAPGTGFYTWVWSIDSVDQTPEVADVLPIDYRFADQFGLVAESHVVPMRISAVSQVSTPETGLGGVVGDQLSVALTEGEWLSENGAPMPAVFEGTAYFVAGDVAPLPSDSVPADATPIGTATVTATAPGIYPASATVTAPEATPGYITWVWALSATSEFADYFEPWSDQFGLPAETTRVAPPTVATVAMPASAIGDEVHDTAMVGGVMPATPPYLIFEAYLQPDQGSPTCDESTLAFTSTHEPVTVTAVGSYDSPAARFESYGTYFWVESLYSHDGQLIHRGECGLAEETTLVAPGDVFTRAVAHAAPGSEVFDTAFVSGPIPRGATLVFEAFAGTEVDGPLCDESTRVFTSDAIPVTGAGRYESPTARLVRPGTYHWVETLLDRNGAPLHIGQCGLPSETTIVSLPSLPNTGVWAAPIALTGIALVLVGIAASGASVLKKRREYR